MPLRVKSRPLSQHDNGPRTPSPFGRGTFGDLPDIEHDDSFREVIKKLSIFISEAVDLPSSFEQLRTTSAGDGLRHLVDHLSRTCTNPAIVNSLLALKWHYGEADEDRGLNDARANACEIVAWRLLTHLSEREAVEYCLYEIPVDDKHADHAHQDEESRGDEVDESTPLVAQAWSSSPQKTVRRTLERNGSTRRYQLLQSISRLTQSFADDDDDEEEDPTAPFVTLNALEIAAVADAKRFLGQNVVQKIITGIWNGDIIFWDNLSVNTVKKPRFYNHKTADPFSRLRVPKYLKSFEVIFFATFLCLYYAVLVERNPYQISTIEILLYIWFAAFFYDELSEWIDAGSIFYATDVWNIFDVVMMTIGLLFGVLRVVGLTYGDARLIDYAFDVLALEALFMVPRVCSILSLSPYWGTLIPCLREMGKDFLKFMVLVFIVYLGFLTTFTLVGRDKFDLGRMAMALTKIFFGSSYVGFDMMNDIDPIFGPPLMILFVTLSSILLMGSMTGMLSNSFSRVITHAREEYLYVYSVYVLEASTSNRLTHFYPPFNLLALVIFRPLRLFLPSDDKFRYARIMLLKVTHLPIVGAIMIYELVSGKLGRSDEYAGFKAGRSGTIFVPNSSNSSARKKKSSRPTMQTRASTSYRPGDASPRPLSAADVPGLRRRNSGMADEDALEQPSDVEVRIADLARKIDRLTDIVVQMQSQNAQPLGDVSLG
ncbi:hypothetical protein CONLIGDRAFT_629588 [Coniochaeta ligniaria NRRL 30616]|uniref:Calcium channel YVC1-like C-terminal transmembrane domain-containing protein n=1 Tax=Coniochaeta ligniaria NRRL 30616 TaxID=1408157 RepID=A0A1J7JRB0_9PEZI|nr:hypothetical protein CONLIGDRAFT_629588 [Coniochaeta ligniaria NRRL 30616]